MNDNANGCLVALGGIVCGVLVWCMLKFVWGCIGWIFKLIDALYELCCDYFSGWFMGSVRAIVCVVFIALVIMGIAAFFDK